MPCWHNDKHFLNNNWCVGDYVIVVVWYPAWVCTASSQFSNRLCTLPTAQEAELAQQTAAHMAEAAERADVEEQRAAMLREAAMLHRYLPKGTIKSEEEWQLLQEAFAGQLCLEEGTGEGGA